MTITIEQLVAVDRKMNDALTELQEKMDAIEVQRKEVRSAILDMMKEQGVDSLRTKIGTVTRTIKERYWTNDWSSLHQYINEHGAVDLLEKRIHQTNMKAWIEDHQADYPPGLNMDREYSVTIRKPRKSVERREEE